MSRVGYFKIVSTKENSPKKNEKITLILIFIFYYDKNQSSLGKLILGTLMKCPLPLM